MKRLILIAALIISVFSMPALARTLTLESSGSEKIENFSGEARTYRVQIALPSSYTAESDVVKGLFEGAFQALIATSTEHADIRSIKKAGDIQRGARGAIQMAEAVEPRPVILISYFYQDIQIEFDPAFFFGHKDLEYKANVEDAIAVYLRENPVMALWGDSVAVPATNIPQYSVFSPQPIPEYQAFSQLPEPQAKAYRDTFRRLVKRASEDLVKKCEMTIDTDAACDLKYADIEIRDSLVKQGDDYFVEILAKSVHRINIDSAFEE